MFGTDQILWYNNGVWGELGYACPNFGDNATSLNSGIHYLVSVIGRNLTGIMHANPDVDLRTPPTIKTLTRVHKLIVRARQIMGGRAVPPSTATMDAVHATPAQQVHLIYPVPYFKVRNPWIKEWCGLALTALGEAMQHTDNHRSFDFSTGFSGLVGQYLHRIYRLMASELFGVEPEKAKALDFILTNEDLAGYDPRKWFTSTEMVDTAAPPYRVPTEDDLRVLTDGIPATHLVGLAIYPTGGPIETDAGGPAPIPPGTNPPGFEPPPGP